MSSILEAPQKQEEEEEAYIPTPIVGPNPAQLSQLQSAVRESIRKEAERRRKVAASSPNNAASNDATQGSKDATALRRLESIGDKTDEEVSLSFLPEADLADCSSSAVEAAHRVHPAAVIFHEILSAFAPPFMPMLTVKSSVDGSYYSFSNPLMQSAAHLPSLMKAIRCYEEATAGDGENGSDSNGDAKKAGEITTGSDVCDRILPFVAMAASQYSSLFEDSSSPQTQTAPTTAGVKGVATTAGGPSTDDASSLPLTRRLYEVTAQTPIDSPHRTIALSKAQSLCIVACSFLCLFNRIAHQGAGAVPCLAPCSSDDDEDEDDEADENEDNGDDAANKSKKKGGKYPTGEKPCVSFGSMPTINCEELFLASAENVEVAKLHMMLIYFSEMERRYARGFGFAKEEEGKKEEKEAASSPSSLSPRHPFAADHTGPSLIFIRHALPKGRFFFDAKESEEASLLPAPTTTTNSSEGAKSTTTITPLKPFVLANLKESIDDQYNVLRVDFANMTIGGGAMSYGCVQEEITFALCPELVATRLMLGDMSDHEAIVLLGAEQFALLKEGTYGFGMQCEGPMPHPEEMLVTSCSSAIVAVDALDYRGSRRGGAGGRTSQYKIGSIRREMVKLAAGIATPGLDAYSVALVEHKRRLLGSAYVDTIAGPSPPPPSSNNANANAASSSCLVPAAAGDKSIVATGNWGCGVFLGDVEMKSLLQWVVCCECDKTMHYYPFDNPRLAVLEHLCPQLCGVGKDDAAATDAGETEAEDDDAAAADVATRKSAKARRAVTTAEMYRFFEGLSKRGYQCARSGKKFSVFEELAEHFGLSLPPPPPVEAKAVAADNTADADTEEDEATPIYNTDTQQ